MVVMAAVIAVGVKRNILMTNHTQKLLELIDFLSNDPKGCPWTKEQTHESLTPYLIEESYEIADSIEQGHTGDELKDELGDMLLQLALQTQVASNDSRFTFDDIAKSIYDKIIRRYPSMFGEKKEALATSKEIEDEWNAVKVTEREAKGEHSVLDGVAKGLPALIRARKIKERAVTIGWEWDQIEDLLDKIPEEIEEIKIELKSKNMKKAKEEIGDLLLAITDYARWHGIDAEEALRNSTNKFDRRYRYVEKRVKETNKTSENMPYKEQHKFWVEAKELEKEIA